MLCLTTLYCIYIMSDSFIYTILCKNYSGVFFPCFCQFSFPPPGQNKWHTVADPTALTSTVSYLSPVILTHLRFLKNVTLIMYILGIC